MDDLLDAQMSPDDVKLRKKKAVSRKFKTVAYRGDQPTRWKRASINGHIFNFDVSENAFLMQDCTLSLYTLVLLLCIISLFIPVY